MADIWQDFPLPDGSYSDDTRPWTHQDLVNYLPVAMEQSGTMSKSKLSTAPGLKLFARLGTGPIRGMRDVEGTLYVVSGTTLYEVRPSGAQVELGTIPGTGIVQMTHNQITGGNEVVIATGSSGYVYNTIGDSADSGSGDGSDPVTSPGGGPASPTPGGGGGYADDGEPLIPLPTVFGSDVIVGGDFSDPGDLDDWEQAFHGNDNTAWSVLAGKAHYTGQNSSTLYYNAAIYRMSPQPLPRYSVTITADARCDALVKVAIGAAVSFNTSPVLPGSIYISDPVELLVEAGMSHTFEYKIEDASFTGGNEYVYGVVVPVFRVINETGTDLTADFDNVTMTITEVSVPVTSQSLTNLDFSAGTDGWTFFPPEVSGLTPRIETGAGWMSCTTIDGGSVYRYAVCNAPITLADLQNKYIHIEDETWCNDPATYLGIPQNGVSIGIATSYQGGPFNFGVKMGAKERGDWTPREYWARVYPSTSLLADITFHLCIRFDQDVGFTSKVRALAVEVTDSAVT